MAKVLSELILPAGTQVVTRADLRDAAGMVVRPRGAVGRIVATPTDARHAYRVRFADGGEAALRRSELSIRKDYQRARPPLSKLYLCKMPNDVLQSWTLIIETGHL